MFPDPIRCVYCFQYNTRAILKAISTGVGFGSGTETKVYPTLVPCLLSTLHVAPSLLSMLPCCIIYVHFATLKLPCTLYCKSWGGDWERGSLIEDTRTLFGSTVDLLVCFYLPPMCAYLVHRRKPLLRPRDFLEKDLFKANWYSYRYKVASFLIWCLVVSFL